MADDDGGAAPVPQQGGHRLAAIGIEIVGRLVEQDDVGLGQDQPGERQAGALAAAERVEAALGGEVGQPDLLQSRLDAAGQGPVGRAGILDGAQSLFEPVEQSHGLGNTELLSNRHPLCHLHGLLQHAERSGKGNRSGGRGDKSGNEAKQGGFARAIAADQPGTAGAEGELEIGEQRLVIGRGPGELVQGNGGGHGRIPDERCG